MNKWRIGWAFNIIGAICLVTSFFFPGLLGWRMCHQCYTCVGLVYICVGIWKFLGLLLGCVLLLHGLIWTTNVFKTKEA